MRELWEALRELRVYLKQPRRGSDGVTLELTLCHGKLDSITTMPTHALPIVRSPLGNSDGKDHYWGVATSGPKRSVLL